MQTLTLVVDERELSTIQAALLILQEQISALPEDLAEMLSEHGPAMTEKEVGRLSRRLASSWGTTRHTDAKHSMRLTHAADMRTLEASPSPE
jgi:hypothetical protein